MEKPRNSGVTSHNNTNGSTGAILLKIAMQTANNGVDKYFKNQAAKSNKRTVCDEQPRQRRFDINYI